LYYNCIRQYTSKNKVSEDIAITSSTLYFKIKELNAKKEMHLKNYTIDHNYQASLSFDMAVGTRAFDFRVIKNMIAKDFINPCSESMGGSLQELCDYFVWDHYPGRGGA